MRKSFLLLASVFVCNVVAMPVARSTVIADIDVTYGGFSVSFDDPNVETGDVSSYFVATAQVWDSVSGSEQSSSGTTGVIASTAYAYATAVPYSRAGVQNEIPQGVRETAWSVGSSEIFGSFAISGTSSTTVSPALAKVSMDFGLDILTSADKDGFFEWNYFARWIITNEDRSEEWRADAEGTFSGTNINIRETASGVLADEIYLPLNETYHFSYGALVSATVYNVPEPGSLGFLSAGFLVLGFMRYKRVA